MPHLELSQLVFVAGHLGRMSFRAANGEPALELEVLLRTDLINWESLDFTRHLALRRQPPSLISSTPGLCPLLPNGGMCNQGFALFPRTLPRIMRNQRSGAHVPDIFRSDGVDCILGNVGRVIADPLQAARDEHQIEIAAELLRVFSHSLR